MRNPLLKRVPRELRQDIWKYIVIFVFMVSLIGIVTGFTVTDDSFYTTYVNDFTEKRIEDGHFTVSKELSDQYIELFEEKADIDISPYFYFDQEMGNTNKTLRVYSIEREGNFLSLLDGAYPENENEIGLDRMFAQNNGLAVGDTLTLKDETFTITGLISSPDYTCLFEKNSDMMFDSINFGVAVLPEEAFTAFDATHLQYNYAWFYPEAIDWQDDEAAKNRSDALIETIEQYDLPLVLMGVELTDYVPRFLNQAINFAGDDMGGDRATILLFGYIVMVILAFVFAVTISSTIQQEAGVIGTLRATGYSRGQLMAHYLIAPFTVSLISAVIGNILGYTVFKDAMINIYYNSFSLAPFEMLWSGGAFVQTTVIPLILMLVINVLSLTLKLRLSPLRFLRHDLGSRRKKKSFRLSPRLPFLHRFRLRIIFQNISGYLVLFCGVVIGGMLMVFGTMFIPLLDDYKELIVNERISDYQYVLMDSAATENEQAEAFYLTALKTTDPRYVEDEVSVYGILPESRYISAELSDDTAVISSSMAEKFSLHEGDTVTCRDPYNSKRTYDFTVGGVYQYSAGMAIFLSAASCQDLFDTEPEEITGYFSNEELTDLTDKDIAALITVDDLTKVSDQLTISMGSMMYIIQVFSVLIFILMMFLLSKQIIEKNQQSISMVKILGYTTGEISRLYLLATFAVVILSLLLTIPIVDTGLRIIFSGYLYTEMSGYIPYIISPKCYVIMVATGLACFVVVIGFLMRKIDLIPKADALKNME